MFSLLILRGISDSQGRIWRCHPDQLYVVEATISNMKEQSNSLEYLTHCLLDILPSITCLTPCEALEYLQAKKSGMCKQGL